MEQGVSHEACSACAWQSQSPSPGSSDYMPQNVFFFLKTFFKAF